MSLTSAIKKGLNQTGEYEIGLVNILRSLNINMETMERVGDNTIKAPYKLKDWHKAALVGTAFDYVARWIIAIKVQANSKDSYSNLNALRGLTAMKGFIAEEEWSNFNAMYNKALSMLEEYICAEKPIDNSFFNIAIFFAKLESIFRNGFRETIGYYKKKENNNVLDELKSITNVFVDTFLNTVVKEDSKVIYNPTFGLASSIMGGADADIIIDNVLYDFKTTKYIAYKEEDVLQILGYYLLSNSDYCENKYNIEKISLYKARFGLFEEITINSLNPKQLEKAIEKFNYFLDEY